MPGAPTQVWVPHKSYDRLAAEVSRAVREYDDRLGFGINPDNGQWCVFMRQGSSEVARGGDLPILGFQTIPSPDQAIERLHQTDARKRGEEILNEINAHNETINRKFADAADEAIGETAEWLEWFNRKADTHPVPRVFLPRGVKKDGV